MALSEQLPIYKASYDLLEKLTDLTKELPRFLRYTLGTRMMDLCLHMLGQIYRANISKKDRHEAIVELIVCYRELLMLLRVCYTQKAISTGRYAVFMELLDSIGRQATGWKKEEEGRGVS